MRLRGIQNLPNYLYSQFLHSLEKDLTIDYNSLLKIEEDYWKIRSRINWLNDGDANTKFYHISVMNRRRNNIIAYFLDELGNWITDYDKVIDHTFNYFQKKFTNDHSFTKLKDIHLAYTSFHNIDLSPLDRPFVDQETLQAIYSLKPFKAPGPDGINPYFIRKTGTLWENRC